jgi:O-antigen ligase
MIAVVVTIGRTGSRGAFVGTLASGAALLLAATSVSMARRVGFVLSVALALVVFAPRGYWAQMNTMADITDDYNWNALDGRRQIAERGLHYMWTHAAFGVGINNFARAECLDPDSPKVRFHATGTGLRCTAPHNSIVQAGAELGIPGLILWLTMICGGVVGMFRLRGRLPAAWARGTPEEQFLHRLPLYLGVAMVGFAVSSTFVGFAWLDLVYFLAALMSGAYAVALQRTGVPPVRYRSKSARRSAELVERFRATQIRDA